MAKQPKHISRAATGVDEKDRFVIGADLQKKGERLRPGADSTRTRPSATGTPPGRQTRPRPRFVRDAAGCQGGVPAAYPDAVKARQAEQKAGSEAERLLG